MSNLGVAPPDHATLVGQTRALIGDVNYSSTAGETGEYDYFSDGEILSFLTAGGDNPVRATGYAYRQLAASQTLLGAKINTDDLGVDTTKRGSDLLAISKSYFDEADAADAAVAGDFDIVYPNYPTHSARWLV